MLLIPQMKILVDFFDMRRNNVFTEIETSMNDYLEGSGHITRVLYCTVQSTSDIL
jgi:hypothetical protein